MQHLRLSLVQFDIAWEDKKRNLEKIQNLTASASGESHIVVVPEMFLTGFTMNPESFALQPDGMEVDAIASLSKSKDKVIIGSLPVHDDGNYFNRLFWWEQGEVKYSYDKRHLFSMAGEEKVYNAGNQSLTVSHNNWKIRLAICYDLRFPVFLRNRKENPYDLLLFVANWPSRRIEHWQALLKARAIENQCYVIGVNRVGDDGNGIAHNGYTSAFAPDGTLLAQLVDQEGILEVTLDKEELKKVKRYLPFLNDADKFTLEA